MVKLKKKAANLNFFGLPAGRDIWEAAPIKAAKWVEIRFRWRPFGCHIVSFSWRSFTAEASHTIELWNCPSVAETADKCVRSFGLNAAHLIQIPDRSHEPTNWDFVYRDRLIKPIESQFTGGPV